MSIKASVTYVHIGKNETEMGIQFEEDDGAGNPVKGRMFAPISEALKAQILAEATALYTSERASLPTDTPSGAVTQALMKKRDALHAADAAMKVVAEAEKRRDDLEREARALEQRKLELELDIASAIPRVINYPGTGSNNFFGKKG